MPLSYTWASGQMIIDDPHADGLMTHLPSAHNWSVHEPRLDPAVRFSADLTSSYGWILTHDLEYIPELRALAPRGQAAPATMHLSDWTVNRGRWHESPTVGVLKTSWLAFVDGRPGLLATGEYGDIKSKGSYAAAQQWWLLLPPVAENETDPVFIDVRWFGDGVHPEYCLRIPYPGVTAPDTLEIHGILEYPALYGRPRGVTGWALIDTWRDEVSVQQDMRLGADVMGLRVEQDAGWWLLQFAGNAERWAYKGDWQAADGSSYAGVEITAGPVGIASVGRRLYFNVQEISYPTEVVATPATYLIVAPQVNAYPTYHLLRDCPTGATVTGEVDALSESAKRPKLTFSATDTHKRALAYNVAEVRPCLFTAATTTPRTTVGSDTMRLLRMSGEQDESLRGATAEVELIPKLGYALPDLGVNDKATLQATFDNGASYYTMHVGYLTPPEYTTSGTEPTAVKAQVLDGIEARLSGHKLIGSPSWAGWPIDEAFMLLLGYGGVPDSLIAVDAAIAPGWEGGYYLPVADPKGDLGLQPEPGTEVWQAIDEVMATRPVIWGWDPGLGKYVLRPRPVHTPGQYDWTLREDALTEDEIVFDFRRVLTKTDFINYLMVMAGRGWRASSKLLVDIASIADPTADDFVGDLVQEVLFDPDVDDIDTYADEIWQVRNAFSDVCYWSLQGLANLTPGKHVRVYYASAGITSGSIYRVRSKHWALDSEQGRLQQEFEAVLVESGS